MRTHVLLGKRHHCTATVIWLWSQTSKEITTTQFERIQRIQKVTKHNEVPDGDDVREKYNKSEEVAKPRTHEPLQCHHDHRQNDLGQEQGLGEAVQLQVQ